jgi:hypothetical protein
MTPTITRFENHNGSMLIRVRAHEVFADFLETSEGLRCTGVSQGVTPSLKAKWALMAARWKRRNPNPNANGDKQMAIKEFTSEHEFTTWFNALDLGPLEDVCPFVRGHAEDNGDGNWQTVKFTVEMYMDDTSTHEVFEFYRN